MTLHQHFSKWLSHRRGRTFKAEDFHAYANRKGLAPGDWRRANADLINHARRAGKIHATGLVRDSFGSWKAEWVVR